MSDQSDDDLPPLEDFEEKLTKIRSKPSDKSEDYVGDYTKTKEEAKEPEIKQQQQSQQQPVKKEEKGLFGGMKKGFLSGSNNKQEKKKETKKEGKKEQIIEYVKAKEPQRNPLEINQVQEQMQANASLLQDSKSWLTQDLMTKLMQNPRLLALFMDPKYSDFIKLLQSNPKEAQAKYGNIPEFNELFKEFCTIMSGHFSGLAEKEPEQKQSQQNLSQQEQEKKIQELISKDREVQEILQDGEVIKVIQMLQKYQKIDFHSIMQKNDILAKKLKVLITKGVLNIQGA